MAVEEKITVAGGTRTQTERVPLLSSLAQGSYELRLTDINGNLIFKDHLIVGK